MRNGWSRPEREMHYTAMDLPAKAAKKGGTELIPLAEDLVLSNSWWELWMSSLRRSSVPF